MSNSSEISYLRSSDQLETTKYPEPAEIGVAYNAATKTLSELIQGMFDAVDDSLFELANNARSNNEQNRFFEAMRDVRIKKQSIEISLQQKIKALFEPKSVLTIARAEPEIQELKKESLSLVGESEMEIDIAATSMATKARANYQGQLLEIKSGFGQLYGAKHPENISYPLDPFKVCRAFIEACDVLEIELKERLLVFKQFDRYVMGQYQEILNNTLSAFSRLGFTYDKSAPRTSAQGSGAKRTKHGAASSTTKTPEQSSSAYNEDFLPALQALLNNTKARGSQTGNHHSSPNDGMHRLLSQLQRACMEELRKNVQEPLNIKASLASEVAQNKTRLSQGNADLINLVSMMFEFILQDYSLAPSMQVLISRLQIPVLKVVMQDKTFFSSSSHPARHLLNSLAKAGIGWSENQNKEKDPLYLKIYDTVSRVLNHFDGDLRLFTQLNRDLDQFLGQEERKAALIEQRTREAEEGRIKSRRAQTKVEETLSKQILSAHHSIPELVINTLKNGWSRVMFLAYLKDADEHQWQNTVDISKELIWCLQPLTEPKDRQRWITVVPKLLKDIEAGLRSVSYSSSNLEETMSTLKNELTTSFKESSYTHVQSPARKDSHHSGPIQNFVSRVKDNVIGDKKDSSKTSDLADQPLKAHLDQVSNLKVGQWVEFKLMNGSQYRCRLSAHIQEADCYIFVNRMGLKPIEKTREELAKDILDQKIVLLDQGLIIDRALNSIMSNLRQDSNHS